MILTREKRSKTNLCRLSRTWLPSSTSSQVTASWRYNTLSLKYFQRTLISKLISTWSLAQSQYHESYTWAMKAVQLLVPNNPPKVKKYYQIKSSLLNTQSKNIGNFREQWSTTVTQFELWLQLQCDCWQKTKSFQYRWWSTCYGRPVRLVLSRGSSPK